MEGYSINETNTKIARSTQEKSNIKKDEWIKQWMKENQKEGEHRIKAYYRASKAYDEYLIK